MKQRKIIAALSALLLITGCYSLSPSSDNLAKGLIDAINLKDKAKLKAFITAHFTSDRTPEQRVERIFPLAEDYAPFTFLRFEKQEATQIVALAKDREGTVVAFILALDQSKPPKIASVSVQPRESAESGPQKDYSTYSSLTELSAMIQKDFEAPAMSIGVYHKGKTEVVATGKHGLDPNSKNAQPDDVWKIGSITKPITTTIIGMLIEQGKLKWDSTLGELFPEMNLTGKKAAITVHQMMMHRSGLPMDGGFNRAQAEAIIGTETDGTKIRANYAKNVLARDLISDPGTSFAYSNAGYSLLGHIAERILKMPYQKIVKTMIFEPLGMKNSFVAPFDLPESRPKGHRPTPEGLQPFDFAPAFSAIVTPAGAVSMSMGDLLIFGKLHMEGLQGKDGLLKSSTIKKLHEAISEGAAGQMSYASGWGVVIFPNMGESHGHNGSDGTFRADLRFFPGEDLIIAACVNRGGEREPAPSFQAVLAVARKLIKKP